SLWWSLPAAAAETGLGGLADANRRARSVSGGRYPRPRSPSRSGSKLGDTLATSAPHQLGLRKVSGDLLIAARLSRSRAARDGDRHDLLLAVETALLERLHIGTRGRFEHRVLRVLDDLVVELLRRPRVEEAEQRVASLQLGDVLGVDRDGGREQRAEPVLLWAEIEKAIDQRCHRLLELGRKPDCHLAVREIRADVRRNDVAQREIAKPRALGREQRWIGPRCERATRSGLA